VLTPYLSSHWVNLITPLPRSLASSLMESLENDVVRTEHDIAQYIPDPENGLTHYEDAVELALERTRDTALTTRWSRSRTADSPSQPLPTDPAWAGGSLHEQVSERRVDADVETLWRVFESIGSRHGWPAAPPAWALRGWTGRAADAAPRPSSSRQLHAGEALDWWRVEDVDRPRLLRLRADVPLPGRLWLELSVRPDGDRRCCYRQRVVFQPHGLAGEVFWTASSWLRGAVFGGIARDVTAKAIGADVSTRT
jgi:hypothetical protein